MADIRQSTGFLDDFDRANESPLSHGGDWGITDSGVWTQLDLLNTAATHKAGSSASDSTWGPLALDGNQAEAWGKQVGGGAYGIAWAVGLMRETGGTNAADGYRFRLEYSAGANVFRLWRWSNGSSTSIAGPTPATAAYANGLGWLLIRRNGTSVEGWASLDTITWTNYLSVVDNNFTTGLHPSFGITDNSQSQILGWDYVGGGPAGPNRPQIYRYLLVNEP